MAADTNNEIVKLDDTDVKILKIYILNKGKLKVKLQKFLMFLSHI